VVHHDVKPSNIMIDTQQSAKLMDFGVARLVDPGLTSSGVVRGTPAYMSPEQILGQPADGRSDIFSLGCVLYEMLTGSSPFAADDPVTAMYRIVNVSPAPVPSLHPKFQAILAKSLAKDPRARFQTCSEFTTELEACLPPRAKNLIAYCARRLPKPAFPLMLVPLVCSVAIQGGGSGRTSRRVTLQPAHVLSPLYIPTLSAPMNDSPLEPLPRSPAKPRQASRPAPRRIDSLLLAGDEAFQQGRYDEALANYSEASRIEPNRPLIRKKLILALTMLGRGQEAYLKNRSPSGAQTR
jgi:serine/threonine protein kinase